MQFYLDGYRPGDPFVATGHPSVPASPSEVPTEVDVLIVGAGPAGLVLAAQLSSFTDLTTAVVERADGPLLIGQADGVACRTMEMLEAFGLADRVMAEAYWVNEVCFWAPDRDDPSRIVRTGRVRDTDEDISELPHVTVNQAWLLAHLRDHMERSPTRLRPCYGRAVSEVTIEPASSSHPVSVTLQHLEDLEDTGQRSVVRAKYVVGCDGARSVVRRAIGRELVGDSTDTKWGVMDVLAITDFPDIRMKSVIRSASEGNILIIPREGGYLVRLYIELDTLGEGEDALGGALTPERLVAVANRILRPYTLEVKEVGWWSVYEIGQRLCDRFDDVPEAEVSAGRLPRVFIAGDACHTHSAKAGQGMNVSMADAWNLGWKLAAVLRGQARPELLRTYSAERHAVAQELIDFDRDFARTMSAPPRVGATHVGGGEALEFQRYFAEHLRYTAGITTSYAASTITARTPQQHLAKGFEVGMRFHSAPVVRVADAKYVQLGHVARADGAWRLYLFADRAAPTSASSKCRTLCESLASAGSPLRRFTPSSTDPDAVIDVRAVLQQPHDQVALGALPPVLLPRKGRFQLVDYEKVFSAAAGEADIFDARGVSRDGCMIVVRPDHYVAHVLPLDAHGALSEFFAGILVDVGREEAAAR